MAARLGAAGDHTVTCACCSRCEAIAETYAQHVAIVEMALDEARADSRAYRGVALATLDALHDVTEDRDRLRARVRDLLAELARRNARAAA